MKVMTVVGTRPELIRLSRVIAKLESALNHVLVHTGQSYDHNLSGVFFDELGITKPKYNLNAAGQNSVQTVGNVLVAIDPILEKEKPDAMLILGDTNSCLAAYAAKRRKIPVFHMEAGNRCFDERVPEEINRKIVDHISDINMPYSTIARDYLVREGLPSERIIKTGSPMREVLNYYKSRYNKSDIRERLGLKYNQYFLFSVHREENVADSSNFLKVVSIIEGLAHRFKNSDIVVSTHPRTRIKLEEEGYQLSDNVMLCEPFSFFDYMDLQRNSRLVLSDSGTITEESSIMKFKALNLRNNHERPEGMEEGAVIMTGLDFEIVMHSLDILENVAMIDSLRDVDDYSSTDVSSKVLKIIMSYTGYVNRKVWGKDV